MFHALMDSMISIKKKNRERESKRGRRRKGEKNVKTCIWVTNVNDIFYVPTSFVEFIEFVRLNSIFRPKLLTRVGFSRIRPNSNSHVKSRIFQRRRLQNEREKAEKERSGWREGGGVSREPREWNFVKIKWKRPMNRMKRGPPTTRRRVQSRLH